MNIVKYGLVIAVAFGLVACQEDAPADSSNAPRAPVVVSKVDIGAAGDFPAGFEPEFRFIVRSKSTDNVEGQNYRKLVVEFQGDSVPAIDKSVEEGLKALGYRRYKEFTQDNGAIVGDYGREGHRITVTTTPRSPDMNLFNAESQGTAYFVWKPL